MLNRISFILGVEFCRVRFYEDQERYEWCRKCKLSGMPVVPFAKENELNRETLRNWMNAYNNIHGKFINVNTVSKKENNIIEENDVRVHMLSEVEKIKKSSHFSRFDHSVVVIEYKGLKVTTSLEQAEKILEKIYDQL
ncbi:MAG: hypothetical protein SOV57_02765 [Bacilli bacterium]|nr:hypothetical protein [Bacilli bacterium]